MDNKKTTLLIDADVLAFEAAVVAEESIEWKLSLIHISEPTRPY